MTERNGAAEFGPNWMAVDDVLSRAAAIDDRSVSKLARESDAGSGYLREKSARRQAYKAANETAVAYSRAGAMSTATDLALDALIRGVISIAESSGEDVHELEEAWSQYRSAIAEGEARPRKTAFIGFTRSLRRTVGRSSARRVKPASVGATDAAMAVVLWDLASTKGPFTPEHRNLLLEPWLSVFPLPEGLSAG
jgi:hypothetical protein